MPRTCISRVVRKRCEIEASDLQLACHTTREFLCLCPRPLLLQMDIDWERRSSNVTSHIHLQNLNRQRELPSDLRQRLYLQVS
jgi:hypothetical protein